MTVVVEVSDDLADWATRAGCEVNQGSQPPLRDDVDDDGRTVIWANHGEIRYFVGGHASGWFCVTSSERMSDETLEFAAESMHLIELYFYGKFGLSLRSSLKLPVLKYPRSADDAVGGYSLRTATFDERENLALVDAKGSAIALTTSGRIAGTAELVCLSYYLASSVEAVKSSYLNPSGQPLFTVREKLGPGLVPARLE